MPSPISPSSDRSSADGRNEAHSSGVSWSAVIAGAFVAAALSLALLALGTGIGLSISSPWTNRGASSAAVGWTTIGWIILIQIIASSIGGYLAGRLRTKWVSVHTHEVYFRDTAHGFLVWAVALVVTAGFLTSAAAAAIGAAQGTSGSTVSARDASSIPRAVGPDGYAVETLLRSTPTAARQDNGSTPADVETIMAHAVREGGLPSADRAYLAQIVAMRTGATASDAEKRVDDAYASAAQAEHQGRKAIAHSMYWTFAALLIGAFCASISATVGGRERDHVPAI